MKIIPQQLHFRQPLPVVIGNIDYDLFAETLKIFDEIIIKLKLDEPVILDFLSIFEKEAKEEAIKYDRRFSGFSYKEQIKIQDIARVAFRCAIARTLTEESYRVFSRHLAGDYLFQNFCLIDNLSTIRVPGKSKLQQYEKYIGDERIRNIVNEIILNISNEKGATLLGLNKTINIENLFMDSTCIKANIHFPVDWRLLKDSIRTLMLSVKIIRREGLKHRMDDPDKFLKEINLLSMKMAFAKNTKNAKKKRKKLFRLMTKLSNKVSGHAVRHRDLLLENQVITTLSDGDANQIILRINNILDQLPRAIHIAYERIIGERKVKNNEKIFSMYDPDVQIMVRNKDGAKVEFGNKLLLVEQQDGIIIDWDFLKDGMASDMVLLKPAITRIIENFKNRKIDSLTTDRGFDSKNNKDFIAGKKIKNHICPKNVNQLSSMMDDSEFAENQKRRGCTEARIGILKNNFIGTPLRAKRFNSRNQSVGLCILTHNLWVIARKIAEVRKAEKQEAA